MKHWDRNKEKADFFLYISLHYTSFTLADRLAEELDTLRAYLKMLTKLINSTRSQIDVLKVKIKQGNNCYDIGVVKSEHHELCKKCDALHKRRDVCKRQRNLRKRRRDEQNIITGNSRDYIREHFGIKGN